jgi:hypothetical protein
MGTEEVGGLAILVRKFHYPLVKPSDLIETPPQIWPDVQKNLGAPKPILLFCI